MKEELLGWKDRIDEYERDLQLLISLCYNCYINLENNSVDKDYINY